ncbi:MAG: M48 family metalloprotease [Planctomycetes bacterium]|nr:M48 family metalloprotease [Planctomycetota bacterium]
MQLTIILALLGALVAAQSAPTESLPDTAERALLCGLLLGLLVIAARIIAAATVAGLQADYGLDAAWPIRYRRLRQIHAMTWGLAIVAIYFGLGWPQLVRENWHLKEAFLLDELLILLPVVLSLFLSWWAMGVADQALESRRALEVGRMPRTVGGFRPTLLLARHLLAPVLVPLLVVVTAQDLVSRYATGSSLSTVNLLLTLPLLLVVVVGFPWALRYLWRTDPLPAGPLRDRLHQVQQRLGVRPREILVWHTDGSICNAVVVGIVPRFRYVLLSDALLERMPPEQIAAVYAHELGHARHGHMFLRLLAVVLPVVLWRAMAETFPTAWAAASDALLAYGLNLPAQTALLTLVIAAGYAATVFSWYCRVLEREADLCGCQGVEDARHFTSALRTLSALTQTPQQAAKASWLHPALMDRIAFVQHMVEHPDERARFGRRMRRLSWLLLAMVAALTLWPLV